MTTPLCSICRGSSSWPCSTPGDDLDLVVLRERLAELGQEVRGRLDAGPVVLVEDEDPLAFAAVVTASRLAPILHGFAHGLEESLDARAVAPVARELSRTRSLRAPQLRIGRELAERRAAAATSPAATSAPFSPSRSRSCAAPTRSERTSGRPHARCLVHDDRPRLALGEEREDVGRDVELDDPLPLDVAREHEPHAELARRAARDATARRPRRRRRAGGARSAASCDRSHEVVEPLLGRETRDGQHDHVVRDPRRARSAAPAADPRAATRCAPNSSTSTVFAKTRTRSAGAPRAIIELRASVPVTRTPAAFATTGGTTVSFTVRRQPGRGPSSWLSTTRTYGTSRSRHQAIAACAANVLQPETTTTSGRDVLERRDDARRERVVVVQHALGARDAHAAEEDRAVLRLDAPGAPGDGSCRVDDREVDLGERGDPVEERRPVRRRLGEDGRDPDRRRVGRRCERAEQVGRVAPRALRERAAVEPDARRRVPEAGDPAARPRAERRRRPFHARALRAVRARERPRRARLRARRRRDACSASNVRSSSTNARAASSTSRGGDLGAEPDLPGEPRTRARESSGATAPICRSEIVSASIALQVAASPRGLLRVEPVQHERRLDAVAFRDVEEPRPEVVVLRLAERRVVAQPMCPRAGRARSTTVLWNTGALKSARQRSAARPASCRCSSRGSPSSVDVEDARRPRARARRRESSSARLRCEPVGKRRVVGVHPSDIAPASLVERAIERSGEPELLVVAEHAHARIVERRERLGRAVRGAVVDDDQLEVGHGLAQDAQQRRPDERLAVVHGDEDGDERRGRHGRVVAYGPCRGSFRRSTSSSRRSEERTSSAASSTRWRRRTIRARACSSSTRTTTSGSSRSRRGARARGRPSAAPSAGSRARATSRSTQRRARTSSRSPTTTASTRPDCCRASAERFAERRRRSTASRAEPPTSTDAPSPSWQARRGAPRPTTTSGTARSRSRSSCAGASSSRSGTFDERLGLGSGEPWGSGEEIDYLVRAVRPRSADRVRPRRSSCSTTSAQNDARDRPPRRRQRRVPPAQARLPGPHRRPHARPAGRRRARRARAARRRRARATSSRRCAAACAATSARGARRSPRDARATARARSARPRAREPQPSSSGGRRARASTASASASG